MGRARAGLTDMALPHPLTDDAAELIAARFHLLAEPMRIKLLDRLRTDEATVEQLSSQLGTTSQNVSKHLGLLAREGVVGRRKRGNFSYYKVTEPEIFELCELVCTSVEHRLTKLQQALTG
jgi:DNA-binding transcriptional ArsR family regulator